MEQEMTKEGWIERMVKIVRETDVKGKDSRVKAEPMMQTDVL